MDKLLRRTKVKPPHPRPLPPGERVKNLPSLDGRGLRGG